VRIQSCSRLFRGLSSFHPRFSVAAWLLFVGAGAKLKPFAAGISGGGVGAAVVFLKTHGVGGLPTLALVSAAAGFFAQRSKTGQCEFAPRRRRRKPAASVAAQVGPDAVFAATPRFVTPPPLAFGQVSHYAPPRIPTNRYVPSTGSNAIMLPRPGSRHVTPGSEADPPGFSEAVAGHSMSSAASIAASPLLTTPVRGSATASETEAFVAESDQPAHAVSADAKTPRFVTGWSQLPGQKNEDTMTVFRSPTIQYIGIFDGHRGKSVASFLAEELHQTIVSTLSRGTKMDVVLETAFEEVNAKVRLAELRGGSTALILCTIPAGTMATDDGCTGTTIDKAVWCANCGDTRAVLFTPHGSLTRISVDHTPDAAGETERVEALGGQVEFNCLDGVLEVCRGFGDFDLVGMTAAPHIVRVDSNVISSPGFSAPGSSDDPVYVLLATDGLWDVATDEDAVQFAVQWLHQHGEGTEHQEHMVGADSDANALLETRNHSAIRGGAGGDDRLAALSACMARWAAERGSRDDISIACVELSASDWSAATQAQPYATAVAGLQSDEQSEPGAAQQVLPHRELEGPRIPPSTARPPRSARSCNNDSAALVNSEGGRPLNTPRDHEPGSDEALAAPMDFSPLSVAPNPPTLSAMDFDGLATADQSCCLEVVSATRGGDASDEWTGDVVQIPNVPPDLSSLPTTLGSQQWDWADRASYEVSFRPANDGVAIIGVGGGAEWLVEMCAELH
jgi:serine/threonine protein phosphatase PrpC